VTAIKVSIPAIVMQMYAREKYGLAETTRFDKFTVSMTHPDGVIAMLAGSGAVDAHFTSPPFHQRERKDPRIRTILISDQVMGGATTFTMISTTTKFRDENPKVCAAVLKALEEANQMIVADKESAAKLLLTAEGEGGFTLQEIVDVLGDPADQVHDDPGTHHEVRGVHEQCWIDQESASVVEGFVLPRNSRSARKLTMSPLLSVEGVTLRYRTTESLVTATYRVSFNVCGADRFVILGPSGCGKSTILKAVGGFIRPWRARFA
jgi:ABC-type multidrug transport system fused ATPase/permease subunit